MRDDGAISFTTDFGMEVVLLLPTTDAYKQRLRDRKQQTSVSSSEQARSRWLSHPLARSRPVSPDLARPPRRPPRGAQKEFRPFAVSNKELSFFEHECFDLAGNGTGIVQITRTDGRPWSSYMLGMLMAMFDARQAQLHEPRAPRELR